MAVWSLLVVPSALVCEELVCDEEDISLLLGLVEVDELDEEGDVAEFCAVVEVVSLVVGVVEEAEELGVVLLALLPLISELLLVEGEVDDAELEGEVDDVEPEEPMDPALLEALPGVVSLCGVALELVVELPVEVPEGEELVEGVVEDVELDGEVEVLLEGDVDAAPWLVVQVEDTMLALVTLNVPSLWGVPVTETVCPT